MVSAKVLIEFLKDFPSNTEIITRTDDENISSDIASIPINNSSEKRVYLRTSETSKNYMNCTIVPKVKGK
jgi:hypothetical protein